MELLNKPTTKVTILCVRFGTKYGREYVERLRNMVARHITVDYEFVCLTDDQHPIDGVRTIYQPMSQYAKPWWHKVHMFDPNLDISGTIIYFDLDVVISNNINKLFSGPKTHIYGIRDFNRKFYASWKSLNSSVMCWYHGEHSELYTKFIANPSDAMRLHGDQDWIWKLAKDKITFWPDSWIQSYKWEIRNRDELSLRTGVSGFKTISNVIPLKDCCVTVFHGNPKPEDIKDPFVVNNWK